MTTDELLEQAQTLMEKPERAEDYLNIDWNTRLVTTPATITNIGVYNDKDSNRLYFRCPVNYGECRVSEYGLRVNYLNTGKSGTEHDGDVYFVDDVVVDGDYMTFSWLVGRHAYLEEGVTAFVVCCVIVDSDNNRVNELNTTVLRLDVLEGLEVDAAPLEDYPDYLEKILRRCEAAESAAESAEEAAGTAASDAAEAKSDAEEAKTAAQTAASDATSAAQSAANAEEVASAAQTVADEAKTVADEAKSVADEAKTTADEAKTNADEALEIAKEASTTAGEAKTNATDAVNAANEALETAKEAKETADDASTVANGIAGTANEALEKASAAVDTANTASDTASEAKETADGIAGTANEALEKATDAWEANKNAITGITVNGEDVPVTDHVAEIEVSGGGYNVSYDDESLVFSGSTLPTYDEPTETLIF